MTETNSSYLRKPENNGLKDEEPGRGRDQFQTLTKNVRQIWTKPVLDNLFLKGDYFLR